MVTPKAHVRKGAAKASLTQVEREVIAFFVRMANLLGMPRSIGEIYGLLFISPRPLHMDELRMRLGLSKGGTSLGLKLLRSFGAVRTVYVPGDRRDHFAAELELRHLVGGFLKEKVHPHLDTGGERIERMAALVEALPSGADTEEVQRRLERLRNWHERARRFLPVAETMIRL